MVHRVKTAFADRLNTCLKRAYGGVVPSIAVIARDFAFKAPHLPHVSGETIRKWMRGDCLPHVSRMQVLIEWLGPEIAEPFENHTKRLANPGSSDRHPVSVHGTTHGTELIHLAEMLSDEEYQSVLAIARLFADKHNVDQDLSAVQGNGHDKRQPN